MWLDGGGDPKSALQIQTKSAFRGSLGTRMPTFSATRDPTQERDPTYLSLLTQQWVGVFFVSGVVWKDGTEPQVSVRPRRAGTECVPPPGELTLGHGTEREPVT